MNAKSDPLDEGSDEEGEREGWRPHWTAVEGLITCTLSLSIIGDYLLFDVHLTAQALMSPHSGQITAMAVWEENGLVATGSADGAFAVWDMKEGRAKYRTEVGCNVGGGAINFLKYMWMDTETPSAWYCLIFTFFYLILAFLYLALTFLYVRLKFLYLRLAFFSLKLTFFISD